MGIGFYLLKFASPKLVQQAFIIKRDFWIRANDLRSSICKWKQQRDSAYRNLWSDGSCSESGYLGWGLLWLFSVPANKFFDSILKQAMITFIYILPNSLFIIILPFVAIRYHLWGWECVL